MSFLRNPLFTVSCLALVIISLTAALKKWHLGLREGALVDAAPVEDLTRDKLLQLLEERQLELLPLAGKIPPVSTYLDTERNETWTGLTTATIGCSELSGMTVVDFLGAGYTKTVLKVDLQGTAVALKSVNEQGTDMRSCLEDFRDPQGCQELVSFKLRKEIVLLQRLKHPNIVKVRLRNIRSWLNF